jgi:hypothetical protein
VSDTGNRAKDAAVNELVTTVVYFAIVGAASLIILKRYYLIGAWRQLTARRMTPEQAAIEREVAAFRQEMARHDHPAGKGRQRGLYESP